MENAGNGATKEEGLRLLKAGQVDEAIAVFEKVLATDEDNAQVHMYLGVAYNHKHNRLRAIHHLEVSLNLQESAKGFYNLGLVYQESHRVDEAVRQFKMAVELDPEYELAKNALHTLQSQHAAAHIEDTGQPEQTADPQAPAGPGQPPPVPGATAQIPAAPQFVAPGAPVQIGQPLIGMPGAPPDLSHTRAAANATLMQARQQQEIKDAHRHLMKSGLTYGAICGCILFLLLNAVGAFLNATFISAGSGIKTLVSGGFFGAVYGSLVGLWMGFTAGDEMAGLQAGLVLGFVYGLLNGLIAGGFAVGIVAGIVFCIFGGLGGYIIGRLVDSSIQQI